MSSLIGSVRAPLARYMERKKVATTTPAKMPTARMNKSRNLRSAAALTMRSEEHTSELQSRSDLVCRLLLEKKKKKKQENEQREYTKLKKTYFNCNLRDVVNSNTSRHSVREG